MIPLIKPINLPEYATLSNAAASVADMGDRVVTTQIKVDGSRRVEFTEDWLIEFNGDEYIHPLRAPQAAKDNQSIYQTIDLTFYHWAIYQLKRFYFVSLANVESDSPMVDKYIVPLRVNLPNFAKALDDLLRYYFPDRRIYVYQKNGSYINPDLTDYDTQVKTVSISYSYLWDVLQQTYELYQCRWTIERDSNGNYAIKFGYAVTELQHTFEYGSNGGLMRVERQVQDANIRNQILGRGGSQNLPYMYFKDYEKFHPNSTDERWKNYGLPDPDAIPELENIYFTELRDSNFRSYVQGWKTNPNRQLTTEDGWVGQVEQFDAARAEEDWAYAMGHNAEHFDPVEYVKDDESIATYGLLQAGLENNEDIFPSLQGMELELPCILGRHGTFSPGHTVKTLADEIVSVEEVVTDEIKGDNIEADGSVSVEEVKAESDSIRGGFYVEHVPTHIGDSFRAHIYQTSAVEIKSLPFEIPAEFTGAITDPKSKCTASIWLEGFTGEQNGVIIGNPNIELESNIVEWGLYDADTDKKLDYTSGLEPGKYYVKAKVSSGSYTFESPVTGYPYATGFDFVTIYRSFTVNVKKYNFNGEVISNRAGQSQISDTRVVSAHDSVEISLRGSNFSVPESGALMIECPVTSTPKEFALIETRIVLYKVVDGQPVVVPNYNLTAGSYRMYVNITLTNTDNEQRSFTTSLQPALLYYVSPQSEWKPTFDIWIKNIFGSNRSNFPAGEDGDRLYMESVWEPLFSTQEMDVTFTTGNLSASSDWIFKVASDGIAYDNSKTITIYDENGNGHVVRSEWRLTLIKSEAEEDAIHKYIPYLGYNAAPGDRFFFTGIYMPWAYVYAAEKALNATKEAALLSTKDIQPNWVVQLDKIRIQRGDEDNAVALIKRMHAGDMVTIKDKRFTSDAGVKLFIKDISYNWQDISGQSGRVGTNLPEVEVHLSDKVETSLSTVEQIQSDIDVLSTQLKGLTNLERAIRKVGDSIYLRKDGYEDTSYSPTRLARMTGSRNFRPGVVGGEGWSAYIDNNGDSILEIDRLLLRKEMQVNNLVINQVTAQGGREVVSAANLTISAVEPIDGAYRCYFDRHDGTISNLFVVDDVALSQTFDDHNNEVKYYKRRVLEVGTDYVVLSDADGDVDGTGVPAAKDVIVQYGNYTDANRRYVIIRDVIGGGYERMLSGLSSVSTNGEEYYFAGMTYNSQQSFIGLSDSTQTPLYDSIGRMLGYTKYTAKPRWL